MTTESALNPLDPLDQQGAQNAEPNRETKAGGGSLLWLASKAIATMVVIGVVVIALVVLGGAFLVFVTGAVGRQLHLPEIELLIAVLGLLFLAVSILVTHQLASAVLATGKRLDGRLSEVGEQLDVRIEAGADAIADECAQFVDAVSEGRVMVVGTVSPVRANVAKRRR